MTMPTDTGVHLRNPYFPTFTMIYLNRKVSADYRFFIRGFSIWDDPKHEPVFADAPLRLQICGTEKVIVNKNEIVMVFQQLLTPTATDRGLVELKQDVFQGNFTTDSTLCTVNTFSATSANKTHGTRGVVRTSLYSIVQKKVLHPVEQRPVEGVAPKKPEPPKEIEETLFKTQLIINKRAAIAHRTFQLNAITKGGVVGPLNFSLSVCHEDSLTLRNRSFSIRENYGIR